MDWYVGSEEVKMTKAIYEAARDNLEDELKVVSTKLKSYPKNAMGLTCDEVKATDEWRAVKAQSLALFKGIQGINMKIRKMMPKANKGMGWQG
jgi:hypothetical protein